VKATGLPSAATILDALLHPPGPEGRTGHGVDPAAIIDPILALHHSNAEQWDREDDARQANADDTMVAAAKRGIDQLNRARHAFIEAIDRAVLRTIEPREGAPLVTESPGMAIDRLSVLVIRLASTEARAASGTSDAGLFAERLPRLQGQLDALEEAIATLLDDLSQGTRRFLPYEGLKLYGPGGPESVG
jgi:hypothetical protein